MCIRVVVNGSIFFMSSMSLSPCFIFSLCLAQVDMNRWNNSSQKSFIETWLKDEGVYDLAVKVPYRQNRQVSLQCSFGCTAVAACIRLPPRLVHRCFALKVIFNPFKYTKSVEATQQACF